MQIDKKIKLELSTWQADKLIDLLENAELAYGPAVEREAILLKLDNELSINRLPGTITLTEAEGNLVFDLMNEFFGTAEGLHGDELATTLRLLEEVEEQLYNEDDLDRLPAGVNLDKEVGNDIF